MNVHFSSKSEDWGTPPEFWKLPVVNIYKKENWITRDVCASKDNAQAGKYWTKEDDCLSKDWSKYFDIRNTWFMNPPYGREIKHFIKKAYDETINTRLEVIALLPARTDTQWFHEYIYRKNLIYFIKGRLKFIHDGKQRHPAPFPSMIVWFNSSQTKRRN